MIKIILAFSTLFVVILSILIYQNLTKPSATINGNSFELLFAKTEGDRQVGLSKYDKLDSGKGMLFLFEKPGYYRFWMKDMKFPIDIIFIKDDKILKIVDSAKVIKENTPLTIYFTDKPIDKVLEINAGLSKKYNFKIGEKVELRNIK